MIILRDMFVQSKHSVKVPRLYKTACKIVKVLKEEGGSVKELVYGSKHPNIKALYALVIETLHHEKQLNKLLELSQVLQQENKLDPWLARVLMTELLWGKKRLSGESKPVKTILSYHSSFIINTEGKDDDPIQRKEIMKVQFPRYARVNTLHMTVKQAVAYFRDEGWILAQKGDQDLFPTNDHFRCDADVPDVLTFPPGTQLFHHALYQDRSILLQDKASCLASHLLSPPCGSVVLDMCAAPGMKTTHLAAIMKNEGTIYAVEKDPKRYKTLCNFVQEVGATCVRTLQEDSVQLNAEIILDVEYILVDPSCSGSGMVRRPDIRTLERPDHIESHDVRLRKLVGFQKRILHHALTSFPTARRVLYSTCSVLSAENEEVISWMLKELHRAKSSWYLVDPLPEWSNRGCEEKYPGIGNLCVYTCTETHLTNGFFMAMFERDDVSTALGNSSLRGNLILEQQKRHFSEVGKSKKHCKRVKAKKKRKMASEEQLSKEGDDVSNC